MAKLTNVRERVHQPFRDTLIRTSGLYPSSVQDRTDLFTQAGKDDAQSNLKNGSTLPSDQSMVVLALRVFTWFRASVYRSLDKCGDDKVVALNGDYGPYPGGAEASCSVFARLFNGSGPGNYQDVYRLHWQSEEQLLWSFGSGQKFSLQSMPTAYFPYGGGLFGDMGHAGANCCDPSATVAESIDGLPAPVREATFSPVDVSLRGSCCEGTYVVIFSPSMGGWVVAWGYWNGSAWEQIGEVVPVTLPYSFTVSDPVTGQPCFDVTVPEPGLGAEGTGYAMIGVSGGGKDNAASCSPLIHWENGTPDHTGILRLARAILLPPRQNVLCQAQIVRLPDGGNGSVFGSTQGPRNMLSLTDNLNALDTVQKVISFTFDGLFSRDVQ